MTANGSQPLHVPPMIVFRVDLPFGRQQVKGRKFEVVQPANRPAVLPISGDEPFHGLFAALETAEYLADIGRIGGLAGG